MINMPTLLKNMPWTQTWVNISFPRKSMKNIWRLWRIIKDIPPQMKSIKMFYTFLRVQTRPHKGIVFNAEDKLPYLSFSEKNSSRCSKFKNFMTFRKVKMKYRPITINVTFVFAAKKLQLKY